MHRSVLDQTVNAGNSHLSPVPCSTSAPHTPFFSYGPACLYSDLLFFCESGQAFFRSFCVYGLFISFMFYFSFFLSTFSIYFFVYTLSFLFFRYMNVFPDIKICSQTFMFHKYLGSKKCSVLKNIFSCLTKVR